MLWNLLGGPRQRLASAKANPLDAAPCLGKGANSILKIFLFGQQDGSSLVAKKNIEHESGGVKTRAKKISGGAVGTTVPSGVKWPKTGLLAPDVRPTADTPSRPGVWVDWVGRMVSPSVAGST